MCLCEEGRKEERKVCLWVRAGVRVPVQFSVVRVCGYQIVMVSMIPMVMSLCDEGTAVVGRLGHSRFHRFRRHGRHDKTHAKATTRTKIATCRKSKRLQLLVVLFRILHSTNVGSEESSGLFFSCTPQLQEFRHSFSASKPERFFVVGVAATDYYFRQ